MTVPRSIRTEADWQRYISENHYVNNGVTGWFADSYGILHWYDNINKWTNEDKRRWRMNTYQKMDYFASEWCILPPPHLIKLADQDAILKGLANNEAMLKNQSIN